MNTLFLSDLFINHIDVLCKIDISITQVFKKVQGKFKGYAKSVGISIEELRLIDVCNDRGELQEKLLFYIDNLPQKKGNSPAANKKYRGEIFSNIRRLVAELIKNSIQFDDNSQISTLNTDSILERQMPEWMHPLLEALPRASNSGNTQLKHENFGLYLKMPLTENASKFLDVLLRVANRLDLFSIESLLVDNSSEIFAELNKTNSSNEAHSIRQLVYSTRQYLNLKPEGTVLHRMRFASWTSKFQDQWNKFEEYSCDGMLGVTTSERMAINHETSVEPLQASSVLCYKQALETGLYYCDLPEENWGVENLMRLKSRTIAIEGHKQEKYYSESIEGYRLREQNRESDAKRKGFDSSSFSSFLTALTRLAVFNGFAHLIEPLQKNYSLKFDEKSTKQKKTIKKNACTIQKLDEAIARLEADFNLAVKNRLFLPRAGLLKQDTKRAIDLCLFYPELLILRFMGLRSHNVRNCLVMKDPEDNENPGGNVGLRRDGTIVFHYEISEMKNKKRLHVEFHPSLHSETHGFLIRGLTTYFTKVYPHIKNSKDVDLDRQLLVYRPGGLNFFAKYPDNHQTFYKLFKRYSNEFLKSFPKIHPHFLRGLCTDWLVNVLHLSLDEAAEYICDNVLTLKKKYLNPDRIHNPTDFVTNANRFIRENAREKEILEKEWNLHDHKRLFQIMNEKDRQMLILTESNRSLILENEELRAKMLIVK